MTDYVAHSWSRRYGLFGRTGPIWMISCFHAMVTIFISPSDGPRSKHQYLTHANAIQSQNTYSLTLYRLPMALSYPIYRHPLPSLCKYHKRSETPILLVLARMTCQGALTRFLPGDSVQLLVSGKRLWTAQNAVSEE